MITLAARANGGSTVPRKQYQQNVMDQRKRLMAKDGWKNLIGLLKLRSFPEWERSMKTLQLLSNSLKHNPWQEPDEVLLRHLGLPTVDQLKPPIVGYMPLPESDCFQEGLATSINLPKDADYCAIAEKFVELANQFLEDVRQNTRVSRITGKASLLNVGC